MSNYGAIIKKNIEQILKERNWRIIDLENKANKGRVVHNILYRTSSNPGIDVMKAISSALNVGIDDLLSEDQKEENINPYLFLDSCNQIINELAPICNKYNIKQSGVLNLIKEVYKYSKDLDLEQAERLSIYLCKFDYRHLNSPFEFDHKMSHSLTPILNWHSPFSSNVINCQV